MDLVSNNVIVLVMCLIFGATTSNQESNRTTLHYSNYQKVTSVSYMFREYDSRYVLKGNNPVVASAGGKNSSGSQNLTVTSFQDSRSTAKTGSSALTTVPVDQKECVVRVVEIIDGEEKLIAYNETRVELERKGKEVFDEICDGDPDWDKVLSRNSLCSLVEAKNCNNKKQDGNFKDKVKKIPKKQ
ncbi:hypothetical protein GE061_010181 [Apolygus lucorum]|uniref:Vitellogenin domain-containing protein n=1 Tax=Apolygus lucorum TaxID=248454 RepID=A0A8S9Y4D3_APOLU|nr:hypothetical protein GE061_010181 [Apolygus lucorum]